MKATVSKTIKAMVLVAIGLSSASVGIFVGETDDAPGAAILGLVMMIAMVALAARTVFRASNSSPTG